MWVSFERRGEQAVKKKSDIGKKSEVGIKTCSVNAALVRGGTAEHQMG